MTVLFEKVLPGGEARYVLRRLYESLGMTLGIHFLHGAGPQISGLALTSIGKPASCLPLSPLRSISGLEIEIPEEQIFELGALVRD